MNRIKRIALIGPESSAKTSICIHLAEYYKTAWVPEYSRNYIENLNRKYTKEDILHCAKEQIIIEDNLILSANKIIFSDTELIVAKVWLLDVFHEYPHWIDEEIKKRKYDLYLLTKPDIPFVEDTVRENPHRRQFFFDWYKDELEKNKFNFKILEGNGAARIELAKEYVKSLDPE